MSERYCAWIRIGGSIERSQSEPLLAAITQAAAQLDWGEPPFEPSSVNDVNAACQEPEGWLWLCNEEARYGEFPELEQACRALSLGYTRFCEAWCGSDAEIVDWRPGMTEPLSRTCSTADGDVLLVDVSAVREALTDLEAGRHQQALDKLRSLCPQIPDLPRLEFV